MTKLIPVFPNTRPLSCERETELEAVLKKHPQEISEYSIGFLYGYLENFRFNITRLNGNICIYGQIHQFPSIFPPIGGEKPVETCEALLKFVKERYGSARVNAATCEFCKPFANLPRFLITDDRINYDYVYSVKEMSELAGSKFQSKRNLVKQFIKNYKYELKPLNSKLALQCMQLQETWCNMKDSQIDEDMSMENRFVYKLLNNFRQFNLIGAAILIDGAVAAFTISEELNLSTAATHVEKANTQYKGIYQAINNFFCKEYLQKYTFVNREQDMGCEGLRKAKLSYKPDHLIAKYNIELK